MGDEYRREATYRTPPRTRTVPWNTGAAISVMVLALLGLGLTGCESDSEVQAPLMVSHTYLGTQSPGDVWLWTVGESTFTATNLTSGHTYSGSKQTLPNLFLKLIVDTTDDPGLTPLPATAYALEFPGTVLMVKPAGSDEDVIVAAGQGHCPTSPATYNWVKMPHTGWDAASDTAYGTATDTIAGSTFTFTTSDYLFDGTLQPQGEGGTFTCAEGKMIHVDDLDFVIGIAPSGVFVGDQGTDMGGLVGVAAPATDVPFSHITAAGREFRGVMFRKASTTGSRTEPVWMRPLNAGTDLKAGTYTGTFEDGTEGTTNYVRVSFTAQNTPGFIQGTLTEITDGVPGTPRDFTFMVNQVADKYMISAIGLDNGDSTAPYNVFMIEQ